MDGEEDDDGGGGDDEGAEAVEVRMAIGELLAGGLAVKA